MSSVDKNNVKSDNYVNEGGFETRATNINDLTQADIDFVNSVDTHDFLDDGSLVYVDKQGDTQLAYGNNELNVDTSQFNQADVAALADLVFLSQNTGVNSTDMNAAIDKLGITGENAHEVGQKRNALLEAFGYTPGNNNQFYGNNTATDVGAQILYDRHQNQPTDQDLIDAGIDPNVVTVTNNHTANSIYLAEKLAEQGIGTNNTAARITTSNRTDLQRQHKELEDILREQSSPDSYWNSRVEAAGSYDAAELNILEWDLIKKLKEKKPVDTSSAGKTGTAYIGGYGGASPGQMTGGDTGGYGGPQFVSRPNIGAVTPVYGEGVTGLTEVDIPTYEEGIRLQQERFQERAQDQQNLYKPQTLVEQQAAGTAPAFENVMYRNRFGMTMYVQHINGVPSQPIPPGYYRVQGFGTEAQTQGGSTAAAAQGQNQGGVIQGFNPGGTVNPALNYQPGGTVVQAADGTYKIKYPDGTYSQAYDTAMNAKAANDAGLSGLGLPSYSDYLQQQGIDMNLPGYDATAYQDAYQSYITDPTTLQNIQDQQAAADATSQSPETGSINAELPAGQMDVSAEGLAQAQRDLVAQSTVAPGGAVAASPVSYIDPNVYGSVIESTAGQALAAAPMVQSDEVAQIGSVTTADTPQKIGAGQVTANQAYSDVQQATEGMTPAQLAQKEGFTAAQQQGTSVSGLTSSAGESVDVTGAPTRTQQTGEMVTGTGVDQARVGEAFGTGEVQAASVQGELANLMSQFEGGETPAWAAGSMRAASQMLAARGLGASSMAGQAVIQAAMEAALPIAQIDASNKQQVALFKAEQRAKFLQMDFDQAFQAKVMNAAKVSEIANMNFTADQQIALENSKAANTMELQNLSNEQALIMAEAAALSQMDTQNLNNRQQAAVQNAQNFLQIDMANLNNAQQTAMFKQQSLINSILSDQAAANAAQQFNATSENQTNQFFANLAASVNQFNAAQMNAMKQFNADEVNALLEFNAGLQNQREMFNAQNYLVVAQANAQWRQNLATINTAAANESNMDYAQTVNGLTLKTLDEIWQRERDLMDYSFTSSENAADRALSILLGDKQLSAVQQQLDSQEDQALGTLLTKVFFSSDFKSIFD